MEPAARERNHAGVPWLRRVGWLVLIWVASVAALGVFAYGMRIVMAWAGLQR